MYKTLCVAALLMATFALTSGSKRADASSTGLPSPVIVAKVALKNQTTTISTTTIFTPTATGLYRISPYMSMTTPSDPQVQGNWQLCVNYTDDVGGQTECPLNLYSPATPPNSYGFTNSGDTPNTLTFRAVAGSPISYSVNNGGNTSALGTYEVFFTVERLM